MSMFRKILIANRGEIAVRVARTARRLGVETVAVYSDADAGAPHVRACDEAVRIGPAPAAESYLVMERIIDAARRTGAEAIHPGYGFLSENAAFADALDAAGLVFIGPTAASIRAMGSKSAAKDLMEKAGVPTTPGYQGTDQTYETFRRECAAIGYPVLLKATAGGGGKGMKIVAREGDLAEALASAQREGMASFRDDRVLVERYVTRARHLEVQIVGDGRGEVVHFFERDCSVQRRHQKIIEEAPAPRLPAETRRRLHEIGVNAGKAVAYRGAGTVECLYDPQAVARDGGVYFMEMNTRLQVEHPVTEEITGVDLVEWQLRVAAGEGLPMKQSEIREQGHAFEARLYAENADAGFTPSVGALTTLRLPKEGRADSGVEEGQTISPYYDPMIAKVIRHGRTREEALSRLRLALRDIRVAGVETNARFLHALAADPDFAAGDVSTRYIEEHRGALFARPPLGARPLAAALAERLDRLGISRAASASAGFRLNAPATTLLWVERDGAPMLARLTHIEGGFHVDFEHGAAAALRRDRADGGSQVAPPLEGAPLAPFRFSAARRGDSWRITLGEAAFDADVAAHGAGVRVFIGADYWDIRFSDPLDGAGADHSVGGSLTAPMPGVVTLLKARPGEKVAAGALLMVMEAMKMEHAISAPHAGTVKAFRFRPGDQVKDGELLIEFEEDA